MTGTMEDALEDQMSLLIQNACGSVGNCQTKSPVNGQDVSTELVRCLSVTNFALQSAKCTATTRIMFMSHLSHDWLCV